MLVLDSESKRFPGPSSSGKSLFSSGGVSVAPVPSRYRPRVALIVAIATCEVEIGPFRRPPAPCLGPNQHGVFLGALAEGPHDSGHFLRKFPSGLFINKLVVILIIINRMVVNLDKAGDIRLSHPRGTRTPDSRNPTREQG